MFDAIRSRLCGSGPNRVIRLAVIFGCLVLTVYFLRFFNWSWDVNISDKTEHWAHLGDYLGGVMNPILGLLTIWLLTTSLRQNQKALLQSRDSLRLSNKALIQAREEVKLTREALEQAKAIQAATEKSLSDQVRLAEESRDFSNAVSLFDSIEKDMEILNKQKNAKINSGLRSDNPSVLKIDGIIDRSQKVRGKMAGILRKEAERLVDKYSEE